VLVSSVSLTSMQLDLRKKMDIEDATLQNRYYLNADQWDGVPRRQEAASWASSWRNPGQGVRGVGRYPRLLRVGRRRRSLADDTRHLVAGDQGRRARHRGRVGFTETSAIYRTS